MNKKSDWQNRAVFNNKSGKKLYDTTFDIYFTEARFYDANNRTWLAIDPIKDGGNWYQYCGSNPATYWDPTGLKKTTSTKQALLAGSEIEPALFWRQRDFFQRAWYQDEETFNLAYQMLLKEAGTSNLSVISLAEMYDYFDYFGYTNTRLATLQALVGAEVTGVYYGQELSAVGSILISQGVEYNSWNPKLTQSTLKELKDWYDSCNKTVRKISYEIENGWGYVISGVTYLSVATVANQQAKAPKVSEGGSEYMEVTNSQYKGTKYDGTRKPENDFLSKKGNSTLDQHASRHGYKLPENYLNDARTFMENDPTLTTQSFVSNEGTYFKYDINTNEFGIINKYGGISTYYKPDTGLAYWLEQIDKYAPK
mgnify:CR=1 FL=1